MVDKRPNYLSPLDWSQRPPREVAEYERGYDQEGRPVILEPSFYKYDTAEYRQLKPQWIKFTEELLQAECIIIVGYSLPEMDTNARSSILTAFQINDGARWLVINHSESVCDLYRRLLR